MNTLIVVAAFALFLVAVAALSTPGAGAYLLGSTASLAGLFVTFITHTLD